jgi:succinate-semialdehyde dehydrogenase / glutarate-semialdehyde dehydrogenase
MPDSTISRLHDTDLFQQNAFINGRWTSTDTRFDVTDPATGKVIAQVANLGADQTRQAIAAAEAALPAWRDLLARERAARMRRWFELLIEHQEDLATLMTLEQGKPLAESRGEVIYGASFIEWFGEEAKRVYGDVIQTQAADRRLLVIKQAIGVCAAITPWNFPIAMITRKVSPALAAGCTIVIKPAEQTPLCALAMAGLARRAGIPDGVINVVTADGERSIEVGKVLCEHPTVRHLSFTGSTEVGRILMAQCAPTVKKLALELGGHAPFLVFDDADLDAAIDGAIASKYRNAGQTCVCTNRFIVQESIYDEFVTRLSRRSAALKVGNGFEDGVEQGPLIDEAAVAKVQRHIADATNKGACLETGGQVRDGRFVVPAVLSDVTEEMLIAQEETFGPVSAVMRFRSEAEAIRLANDTPFGLAAYFYSRDIGRIWRVAEALEYGMVGINAGIISYESVPFGGVKQSGYGREGSRYGIDEYIEMKYLCMAGI